MLRSDHRHLSITNVGLGGRLESRLLVEGPEGQTESRLHTLQSRNSQKGGGVAKSGLVQTFSEENIMNLSLIYSDCTIRSALASHFQFKNL